MKEKLIEQFASLSITLLSVCVCTLFPVFFAAAAVTVVAAVVVVA